MKARKVHHLLRRGQRASAISLVSCTKSATFNRSARNSYNGLSLILFFGMTAERALRKVLRRGLKPALTTRQNTFSAQSSFSTALRVMRITPERTFGGGLNAPALTVKRYSTS